MACDHFYKGHKLSEKDLDDFLLGNGKMIVDKYGDTVFNQLSPRQYKNYNALKELESKGTKELLQQIKDKTEYGYNVGGKYKSITHVLSGIKSLYTDKYIFPEFIVENYFKTRRDAWGRGDFSEKEQAILFPNSLLPTEVSEEMKDEYEKQIIDAWEAQAKIGTEIHKGLQYYFSSTNGNPHRNMADDSLRSTFRRLLDDKYINDKQIDQLLLYCRSLQSHFEEIYGGKKNGQRVKDTNLIYFTEMPIFGELMSPETGEPIDVLGKIDLIILDSKGNIHTIDYKTSPADYDQEKDNIAEQDLLSYSKAKKLAFTYQLSIYDRLLQSQGTTYSLHDVAIAPIQITDFKKTENGWGFEDIKAYNRFIDPLTKQQDPDSSIYQNLNMMFPSKVSKNVNSETFIKDVNNVMAYLFSSKSRKTSRNPGQTKDFVNTEIQEMPDIIELCKEHNMQQDAQGKYTVTIGNKHFTADTETELYNKVKKHENNRVVNIRDQVDAFKRAVTQYDGELFETTLYTKEEDAEINFMPDILNKYCSGAYEVYSVSEEMDRKLGFFGIVLLKNNITNNIEVIKISGNNLRAQLNNGRTRENLIGKFEEDINENSKSDSFMLKAKFGNIDLMETMIALNFIPEEFQDGAIISKIHVINPRYNQGMEASSKELKYSFNKLTSFIKDKNIFEENNFENGRIVLADYARRVYDEIKTLLTISNTSRKINNVRSCVDALKVYYDQPENPEKLLKRLEELKLQMESNYPTLKNMEVGNPKGPNVDIQKVYSTLLIAIAETKNIHFRQQNFDPDNWRQESLFKVFTRGHTGLMTDNPGVMANHNLNVLSEVYNRALQNTSDRLAPVIAKVREMEEKLKKSKSFTYMKERFYGNKINLYRNMTYYNDEGDWLFKRPEELSDDVEREFLEFALETINKNRWGNDKRLQKWKETGAVEYYRVPLLAGGDVLPVSGMFTAIKDKLKSLHPKVVLERVKEKLSNSMSEDSQVEQNVKNNRLWEMTTRFDGGEDGQTRMKLLNEVDSRGNLKRPRGYYENNLGKLLFAHCTAYIQKEEVDKVLPIYKAGELFQVLSGLSQNKKYINSLKYLQNYIKVNIFNRPLVSDRDLVVKEYANKVMSVASTLALGFAPRQLYQNLEGIWKGIGLVLRNPTGNTLDGVRQFNKKDFIDSFFNTYAELKNFGNSRSKLELLNERFRLNDMDINAYAERMYDEHSLIFNPKLYLYRMASRPDFYNRLTIFQTQMRADGTWDAYSVQNGRLVYDWKKDKRFDIVSQGVRMKSHPEYNKQFALFREMALQLEREGAIDQEGNPYKWKNADGTFNPLPTAYTRQQSESYKALSDMLYGYYSHEKRSLMQASLLGSMVMQMYTYWSGKKNQYFAAGSVKNQGKYVHATRDGKPLYYQLKPNGEIDFDAELTTNPTNAPVVKWQGQYHEGVMLTATQLGMKLLNGVATNEKVKDIWDQYYNNPDENLRTIYRSNLIQLSYDTLLAILIGGIAGSILEKATAQYVKDHRGDSTAEQALKNTIAVLSSNIFKASVLDLNAVDSIYGRGLDWTPFSLKLLQTQYKNWSTFLKGLGDEDNGHRKSFTKTIINSFSFTRQTNANGYGIWSQLAGENN